MLLTIVIEFTPPHRPVTLNNNLNPTSIINSTQLHHAIDIVQTAPYAHPVFNHPTLGTAFQTACNVATFMKSGYASTPSHEIIKISSSSMPKIIAKSGIEYDSIITMSSNKVVSYEAVTMKVTNPTMPAVHNAYIQTNAQACMQPQLHQCPLGLCNPPPLIPTPSIPVSLWHLSCALRLINMCKYALNLYQSLLWGTITVS
ncbi:hypothetical protein EDC04DRAFT_2602742 [Pisolithus marmoratus]|nr:hypothetical protein EDC04DRAFT_2602742 [Pisolithus marmoratus]